MTTKEVKRYILRMSAYPREFGVMVAFGNNPSSANLLLPDKADFIASSNAALNIKKHFDYNCLTDPMILSSSIALYADLMNAYISEHYEKS